jgi:hypothetical protein
MHQTRAAIRTFRAPAQKAVKTASALEHTISAEKGSPRWGQSSFPKINAARMIVRSTSARIDVQSRKEGEDITMLDSAGYRRVEKQQELADSHPERCDPANDSPECEREALSLAERMTGIAPRPRKPQVPR